MFRFCILFLASIALTATVIYGQETDSLQLNREHELKAVEIFAYFNQQPILDLTASGQTVTTANIETQQTTTLLPAMNTVPGIRMEERSPGSYRLAMRGSLIRSPFGIRNVKIYVDEFPLTDAGGNTYLNLLDPASISAIHILKGPDGSLYGANSGGVIRIEPNGFRVTQNQASLQLSGGSFGLFQEQLSVMQNIKAKYSFSIDQSYTRSDGYRENTALDKKTIQTAHKWQYSEKNQLRFLALYSDLKYQTPGGLTVSQMQENPRMARPGAMEQQAGIYNKTFFGGIAHDTRITNQFSHTISLSGSHTDLENPFITNYEFRKEKNLGLRTYFSYKDNSNENFQWQMQLGFERQMGWNSIDNYDNDEGTATAPQAMDDLDNTLSSFFYRTMFRWYERLTIEASLGLNQAEISYQQRFPEISNSAGKISFGTIFMPRIATSYLLEDGLAVRASVSKGYSPPTIAEVRSSDNLINTEIEPETGINYELGMRLETTNRRWMADLSIYHYNMDNGIVRHLLEHGAEYYVNAGEIKQRGIEAAVWMVLLPVRNERWVQSLSLQSSVSYNQYRFGKYRVNNEDYSGNNVTAVPDWVWSNTVLIALPNGIGLNISHYFTSEMPLNDANTVFADSYHLVQIKGNWKWNITDSKQVRFFAGIDNVLNKKYSLGNDINAFGDRYFNPAPTGNYYGGLKVVF